MAGPKIVFSVPAHEGVAVIQDQIANLRRFVPGSQVVLHLSEGFYYLQKRGVPVRSAPWMRLSTIPGLRAMPGVFVNDARMRTEWGNILHTHLSNFRYADRHLDFDYFVLLSSSCLLVRSGAAELMAEYDYGVIETTPKPEYEWRAANECDPVFQAIQADCGASELCVGQSEGTYYRRDAFRHIADTIERHWSFTPGHIRVHEEVYLPTVASTLGGRNGGSPIILKKHDVKLPPLDASLVDRLRREEVGDFYNESFAGGTMRMATIHKGAHLFGMRPVPRKMDDPLRRHIRDLPV